jgi:hypothetical protein
LLFLQLFQSSNTPLIRNFQIIRHSLSKIEAADAKHNNEIYSNGLYDDAILYLNSEQVLKNPNKIYFYLADEQK